MFQKSHQCSGWCYAKPTDTPCLRVPRNAGTDEFSEMWCILEMLL